jgi:hypothetical protein
MFWACSVEPSPAGECGEWVQYVGLLPYLTIGDGVVIGGAIMGTWAVAYVVRTITRAIVNR